MNTIGPILKQKISKLEKTIQNQKFGGYKIKSKHSKYLHKLSTYFLIKYLYSIY